MIIDVTHLAASASGLIVTALLVKFLPKALALARLDRYVHDNTLILVNAAIIAFVLVTFVILPLARLFGTYAVVNLPL